MFPLQSLQASLGDSFSQPDVFRDFLSLLEPHNFPSFLLSRDVFPRGRGSANVFSEACQHSFSFAGLGSNLLLPHLGNLAYPPNAHVCKKCLNLLVGGIPWGIPCYQKINLIGMPTSAFCPTRDPHFGFGQLTHQIHLGSSVPCAGVEISPSLEDLANEATLQTEQLREREEHDPTQLSQSLQEL